MLRTTFTESHTPFLVDLVETRKRRGCARSENFVLSHDSARDLQHSLNTIFTETAVPALEVSINIIASIKLASPPFGRIQ